MSEGRKMQWVKVPVSELKVGDKISAYPDGSFAGRVVRVVDLAEAMVLLEREVIFNHPYVERPLPPPTYRIGQRFKQIDGGPWNEHEYILAQVSTKRGVSLVDLDDGDIWGDPVTVLNADCIAESEFQAICGCGVFRLIEPVRVA